MTPTAVYVIGAPGTGKTTLMTNLLRGCHRLAPLVLTGYGTLVVQPLTVDGHLIGQHLGRDQGTDTLSFNVQPHALRWAREGHLPARIYGEGHRLGNAPFLTALAERANLTVVHLVADRDILATRPYGGVQVTGADTKALRTAQRCEEVGIPVVTLDASGTPEELCLATVGALA